MMPVVMSTWSDSTYLRALARPTSGLPSVSSCSISILRPATSPPASSIAKRMPLSWRSPSTANTPEVGIRTPIFSGSADRAGDAPQASKAMVKAPATIERMVSAPGQLLFARRRAYQGGGATANPLPAARRRVFKLRNRCNHPPPGTAAQVGAMRYGVWTPLPHTIRPEPAMNDAMRESGTRGAAHGPDKAFRFAVEMLQRAEALGFESTLIAERWLGTDHPAWMLASALAPLTRKIELMVAVHPGIITPQVVAKFAVSLDRISGGRAAINIVNGWWKEEFETFGNGAWPPDDAARYRRMDEFVRVMRGLWTEDTFEFHGEFYSVDRQGLPLKSVQLPNPPLYAGSRHDPGKDVIVRDCDCWFVDCLTDYRRWEDNLAQAGVTIAEMNARAARY